MRDDFLLFGKDSRFCLNSKERQQRRPSTEPEMEIDVHTRGERGLWRAVLTQALMDAASHSRKPENQFHKHEATAWLTGFSKDFVMVCDLADLDPSYVRRAVKRALLSGCKWRTEAGTGRRKRTRRLREAPSPPPEDTPP